MDIYRDLPVANNLIYKNNPSSIVVLDSRNRSIDIESMDIIHKGLGMKMFGYHYMIYRDGTIQAGRPERAFSCDVVVLNQVMQNNLPNTSPLTTVNLEVESATDIISAGRIFICLEGNTSATDMTLLQRNSLIELGKDIRGRYRNIRNIYSYAEFMLESDNLGIYVDFNTIRSEINSTFVPVYVDTPAGTISYTYGKRELYFDPEDPISGNDVKLVQVYLKTLDIPLKDTAGIYNLYTFEAVKSFQRMFGLEVTGTMKENEYNLLAAKIRQLSVTIDYSQYHRYLYYRSYNPLQGLDVDNLQDKLGRLNLGTKSGTYDYATQENVKVFQRSVGIEPDGEVGPLTWRLLNDSVGVEYTREFIYDPNHIMRGDDIKFIQQKIALIARRFGIIEYHINGKYDLITYNNIRKIQSQTNFPINGIVDDRLFKYLIEITTVNYEEPTTALST